MKVILFYMYINSSRYHEGSANIFNILFPSLSEQIFKSSIIDVVVANHHISWSTGSFFHHREKHSSSIRIRYFCAVTVPCAVPCAVSLAFNSSTFQKTAKGWKGESEPIPTPNERHGRSKGEQMATKCEKRVKTKRWKQKTIGYDSHLLSSSPLLPLIHFPRCVSTTCATPMSLKDANISLPFVACGISRSLFPSLRGVSHVLSLNSLCEIRIAGFVRTTPPVIYGDSCLS